MSSSSAQHLQQLPPLSCISTHEEMNPSKRSTMEDCSLALQPGEWDSDTYALAAIMDGHGGRDIVDFLETELSKNLAQELHYDGDEASVGTRIERAFLLTDIQSRKANLLTSGATVALCLIKRMPDKRNAVTIHAANVGDARAVLSCTRNDDGVACRKAVTRLTFDHRADDPGEEERIKAAGGFVHNKRVLGILAVARSLGDHGLKEYVVAKPYVSELEICETAGEFVIVACDGLWDVLTDDQAVDLVRDFVAHEEPLVEIDKLTGEEVSIDPKQMAAEMLVHHAIKKGSTDNISAIVAWL